MGQYQKLSVLSARLSPLNIDHSRNLPVEICGINYTEKLTRDRRAAGSSLTGVTALWSLSKTHLSQLSTGTTQEEPSRITERLLSGRKESNQTNKQIHRKVYKPLNKLLITNLILSCHYFISYQKKI